MSGKALGVILLFVAGWLLLRPALASALPVATTLISHVDTAQLPDVRVFLTVLDDAGNPMPQLSRSDLQLLQDGTPQEIAGVTPSTESMAIVLAMDTSGSMGTGTPGRQPIDQARVAAEGFVTYIKDADAHSGASLDQIAIVSFNEKPTLLAGLSTDHNAAINAIRGLRAEPKWTSLYDAAYRAVKVAGEAQMGQRAVVLFTDGWDEGPKGKPGSAVTFDDVVNLARQDNVPIYPIGLGDDIDQPDLGRMAMLTSGSFLSTADPAKLSPLFQHIAAQLKSKYLITFESSAVGDHNIQVTVRHDGGQAVDHRVVTYPKIQPVVQVVEPKNGSLIQGDVDVVLGVGKYNQRPIVKVEYRLAGQLVQTVESQPFIFHLNPTRGLSGPVDLEATAFDSDGLAGTDKVTLTLAPLPSATSLPASPTPTAVSGPTALPLATAVPVLSAATVGPPQPLWPDPRVVAGAIGVVGLGIIFGAFVMGRLRRSAGWSGLGAEDSTSGDQGSLTVSYGSLTIVDGPDLVGRIFPLPSEWVKIGREGSTTDVVLPDPTKQVSRDHAAISCNGPNFLIQDLGSLNGTRVDGKPIGAGESVGLTHGVEILLANTYRLRFNGLPEDDDESSRTRPIDPVDTLTL